MNLSDERFFALLQAISGRFVVVALRFVKNQCPPSPRRGNVTDTLTVFGAKRGKRAKPPWHHDPVFSPNCVREMQWNVHVVRAPLPPTSESARSTCRCVRGG